MLQSLSLCWYISAKTCLPYPAKWTLKKHNFHNGKTEEVRKVWQMKNDNYQADCHFLHWCPPNSVFKGLLFTQQHTHTHTL